MTSPAPSATGISPTARARKASIRHLLGDYGILLVFAAAIIYLAVATPEFLTLDNLTNVVRQSSIIGFLALGMTFVMITSGIDLSVGSTVGLVGVVAASLTPSGSGALLLPIVVGLLIGLMAGAFSAGLVVRGGVIPFLATLAMMAILRSAALVFTNGQPITQLDSGVDWL
ncbi:MAG: ABC transporter permease, partial [Propionicimonas sp.]|nr:ABC transporter permease [Propionicimonas sp.]